MIPIGRFQIMAVLQAARAHVLGLPISSAKAWGYNRAIFYNLARSGLFSRKGSPLEKLREVTPRFRLGNEEALLPLGDSGRMRSNMRFTMGDQYQTDRDYDPAIVRRFGRYYESAWADAMRYVGEFSKDILENQGKFYSKVYVPVRDRLAHAWTLKRDLGKTSSNDSKRRTPNKSDVRREERERRRNLVSEAAGGSSSGRGKNTSRCCRNAPGRS